MHIRGLAYPLLIRQQHKYHESVDSLPVAAAAFAALSRLQLDDAPQFLGGVFQRRYLLAFPRRPYHPRQWCRVAAVRTDGRVGRVVLLQQQQQQQLQHGSSLTFSAAVTQ